DSIKEKNASLYAIRLTNSNQYVNEKNRAELLSLSGGTKFHDVEICFNLETEDRLFVERMASLKLTNLDALIAQLASLNKFIAADRIFAYEFFAKGGKKMLIDYIKESERTADPKKWSLLLHLYRILFTLVRNWSLLSWD